MIQLCKANNMLLKKSIIMHNLHRKIFILFWKVWRFNVKIGFLMRRTHTLWLGFVVGLWGEKCECSGRSHLSTCWGYIPRTSTMDPVLMDSVIWCWPLHTMNPAPHITNHFSQFYKILVINGWTFLLHTLHTIQYSV